MARAAVTSVFLIGKETTKGTPVSATKDIGLVIDSNSDLSREVVESKKLTSIGTEQVTAHSVDVAGSLTVEFQHGRLLEYIFGSVAHAETTGDWKHTFTEDNSPPFFTLEDSENAATDAVMTHYSCMIDSAELSFGLNQNVQLRVDYKALGTTNSTSASAAVESTLVVLPQWMQHVSLNGTEATEIQEFRLNITKNVLVTHGLGAVIGTDLNATELAYSFTGKLGFSDTTYHQLMQGSTTFQTGIAAWALIMNAHNGVALGSGRREIKVTLSVHQGKLSKPKSVGGLVFIDIEGKGILTEAFSVDNISSGSW